MKRIYTFLIVIMFNMAFLMSACTAGNADSTMSAVSETSATGTVIDKRWCCLPCKHSSEMPYCYGNGYR
mgnify:CR=1 FL=1